MSVANGFSVSLFLNHGNDMRLEKILTVKSKGLRLF